MGPRTLTDVILYERVFDRSKDIEDIKAMLATQTGKLDLERIRAGAAQLLDAAGAAELEALIRDFYR